MPENVIRVMCPNLRCRAILAVPAGARGRLVRCRACATNIKIPTKPPEVAKTDAAEAPAEKPKA
ncbi:MAG: hypothetical protein SFZ24_04590 [Planctomycetota bacterium]|nr:hypothetical protein [Planctomycetota bacterium]